MYDILIVGGGTAGLTAAIYARRAGKTVLVLEGAAFGGQIASSPLVENYPGIPSVSGPDYAGALTRQAADLGAETAFRQVTAAGRTENGFLLTAGKKTFEGRALILATGARHRKLGVPGEDELVGRGVSYCAVCDGAFFAGKDVAVIGGGDSALQSALFLANRCRTVYLVHRREEFRGAPVLVRRAEEKENIVKKLSRTVSAFEQAGTLTGVTLKRTDTGETEHLPVAGVFVTVGQEPDNAPFAGLVELDGAGYIKAGEDCVTRTPGVYAAGDCRTKELRQLTTAAADGSVAATAACRWLDEG
ncbi:MAG: FAD-dependent oxidoreductase [Clostridiales bacterium]|nr:FAD-dependent oxidoreductase [Clostridiales bacterium]